jgi:hypothetical protein
MLQVYTFHTRLLVRTPSNLSWLSAGTIFIIGLAGVLLNFWADNQVSDSSCASPQLNDWLCYLQLGLQQRSLAPL